MLSTGMGFGRKTEGADWNVFPKRNTREADAYKRHAWRLQQFSLISLRNLRGGKSPRIEISYFKI